MPGTKLYIPNRWQIVGLLKYYSIAQDILPIDLNDLCNLHAVSLTVFQRAIDTCDFVYFGSKWLDKM
jgi:hypothetical protein